MTQIWVGTSGYTYSHWRDVFYPKSVPQREWLEYYANAFKTVELNVTFYRLPPAKTFQGWYQRTPGHFRFAVKGNRFITHLQRLRGARESIKRFLGPVRMLREKLAVILWQLPPHFGRDLSLLGAFLSELYRQGTERHVVEFRDKSWLHPETFSLLKERKISLCFPDKPDFYLKTPLPVTSDFIYVRRHGIGRGKYSGCYSKAALQKDARRYRLWLAQGKEVFVYFNNDAQGYAVQNAATLLQLLKS